MATKGINPDGSERDRLDQLPRQAFAFQTGPTPSPTVGPTEPSGSSQPQPSRGLNPRFALWLMGFPTDWLDGIVAPKKSRPSGP